MIGVEDFENFSSKIFGFTKWKELLVDGYKLLLVQFSFGTIFLEITIIKLNPFPWNYS